MWSLIKGLLGGNKKGTTGLAGLAETGADIYKDVKGFNNIHANDAAVRADNYKGGVLVQATTEAQNLLAGGFGQFVDALNRLPRPLFALGVFGLFAYAMIDPAGFSLRMEGLALIPEQLWWLFGAVISFYFGARELHHARAGKGGGVIGGVKRYIAPPQAKEAVAEQPDADEPMTAAQEAQAAIAADFAEQARKDR